MVENWLPVVGYEGLYEVSDIGNVRNMTRNVLLSINKNHKYSQVELRKDGKPMSKQVHRILAEAFLPIPTGIKTPVVNHINRIGTDNRISNLEWVSHSDNIKHNFRTGQTSIIGEYWKGKTAHNVREVINIETGILYDSVTAAAIAHSTDRKKLSPKLLGKRKNNTKLQYL